MVMVLNALQLPAPAVPEYDPYHTFTQDNLLNEQTDQILPREVLAKQGMTLDQLGGILGCAAGRRRGPPRRRFHRRRLPRQRARLSRQEGQFVIINYLRKAHRPGARRPHLAAGGLRRRDRPVPDPRRVALQIPAGLGRRPPICSRAMNTTDSDNHEPDPRLCAGQAGRRPGSVRRPMTAASIRSASGSRRHRPPFSRWRCSGRSPG